MVERIKQFLFGGAGGKTALADFGLMLVRGSTGLFLALGHGRLKIPPPDMFVKGVGGMGLHPAPLFAWLAALSEFGGGLLLAFGLLTRPAALMIVGTMAVAVTGVHWHDPLFMSPSGGAKEPALLFLMPALAFLFTGSGRYGLDALFRPRTLANELEDTRDTRRHLQAEPR